MVAGAAGFSAVAAGRLVARTVRNRAMERRVFMGCVVV
jgi:hypothetical protein